MKLGKLFVAFDGKTPMPGKVPDNIAFLEPVFGTPPGIHADGIRNIKSTDPDWDMYLEHWAYRQGYMARPEFKAKLEKKYPRAGKATP